jgi:hypothetical protein
MTPSTRISFADLADATGIVPSLLAAEVEAIQRASHAPPEPEPLPHRPNIVDLPDDSPQVALDK